MTIRAIELGQSATAIIEEQRCVASGCKFAGYDVRPAFGVSMAGELADAALSIRAVELGQSTAAIIEEQRAVVTSCCKITRNDVRPALGVGAAGEQANVG